MLDFPIDYFEKFNILKTWVYKGVRRVLTQTKLKENAALLKEAVVYNNPCSQDIIKEQLKCQHYFLERENFNIHVFSNNVALDALKFKGWRLNRYSQYSKVAQFFCKFFLKNNQAIIANRSRFRCWDSVQKFNYALFTPLGGSQEVGASAYLLETDQFNFLIDYGLGFSKNRAPFLEYLDLNKLGGIFITHGHTDHCGLIPLLYAKGYAGPIYSTQGTAYNLYLACKDYLKLSSQPLYTEKDLETTLKNLVIVQNNSHPINSINLKVECLPAGHMIGSSMFKFSLRNKSGRFFNILFTGDYRTTQINNLFEKPAYLNNSINVIVTESTYGSSSRRQSLYERADQIINVIKTSVENNSHVLIPTINNRSAEIAIQIVNLIQNRAPELLVYVNVTAPVKQSLNLYKDCAKTLARNWEEYSANIAALEQEPASALITITSPGMVEGGESLSIFKKFRTDPNSAVILTNFCPETTIGRAIIETPEMISIRDEYGNFNNLSTKNKILVLSCFSGHVNGADNLQFIKKSLYKKNEKVILVHGAKEYVLDLKKYLRENGFASVITLKELERTRLF